MILRNTPLRFDPNRLSAIPPTISLSELVESYRTREFNETGQRPDYQIALFALDRLHEDLWEKAAEEMQRESPFTPVPDGALDDDFNDFLAWPALKATVEGGAA